ncbi:MULTISPECIES: Chromate resistance protein ChrB [Rhizobium]|uniref:Chromate resistance protein ChrB n=1 Tax=Rhizobium TaxID=379 RepID=UPI00195D898B|nr:MULTISPECIES: Chromate resistance protein ChrB [Rhizobium]MBM7045476.1 chromate resistance protein ChrB [Rhizobium lusitanum]
MTDLTWLLLIYKVPTEPAAKRVALWRKLKGLGAVYLQNGVCLLPKTDENARRMKMLDNDVAEMGGEAVLLETAALDPAQQERVASRFKADRDEHYREFLERCGDFEKEIAKELAAQKFTYAELEEEDADLKKLQDWLEKIRKLDFYGAPLAVDASERLKACEKLLDAFASQVFEAHEETRSASNPLEPKG